MQQRGSAGVWRHGTLHGGICMHHGTCMNSGIVRTNMLYIMPGFGRTDVRMGMPARQPVRRSRMTVPAM